MNINFHKYQGTGNDFIMIDNRSLHFPKGEISLIAKLCDRRFGIGADGLILLENSVLNDFSMVYFNANGNQSTMCGNGGRCLVAFAKALKIIGSSTTFDAIDGLHTAIIENNNDVTLQMQDVKDVRIGENSVFLNTGSPHHVELTDDLHGIDIQVLGSKVRYDIVYEPSGTNVNYVSKIADNTFAIRTYERGVEAETLSCGTGATAVAIAMHATGRTTATQMVIIVQGGQLEVSFEVVSNAFTQVKLCGSATFVFAGQIEIEQNNLYSNKK